MRTAATSAPTCGYISTGCSRSSAYLDNGKIYLSMESVSDFYSLGISAVFKDGELYFTGPNFDMYVNSDVGYTRVNGRYLYTPDGYFRSGGQIYLPLEVLARMFGFEYSDRRTISRALSFSAAS
ncbi:MAG: hypothetical protein V8S72_07910 [Oscillospiraceae bacterium]